MNAAPASFSQTLELQAMVLDQLLVADPKVSSRQIPAHLSSACALLEMRNRAGTDIFDVSTRELSEWSLIGNHSRVTTERKFWKRKGLVVPVRKDRRYTYGSGISSSGDVDARKTLRVRLSDPKGLKSAGLFIHVGRSVGRHKTYQLLLVGIGTCVGTVPPLPELGSLSPIPVLHQRWAGERGRNAWRVLVTLRHAGQPLTAAHLSKVLGLSKRTISRTDPSQLGIAQELANDGLVAHGADGAWAYLDQAVLAADWDALATRWGYAGTWQKIRDQHAAERAVHDAQQADWRLFWVSIKPKTKVKWHKMTPPQRRQMYEDWTLFSSPSAGDDYLIGYEDGRGDERAVRAGPTQAQLAQFVADFYSPAMQAEYKRLFEHLVDGEVQ